MVHVTTQMSKQATDREVISPRSTPVYTNDDIGVTDGVVVRDHRESFSTDHFLIPSLIRSLPKGRYTGSKREGWLGGGRRGVSTLHRTETVIQRQDTSQRTFRYAYWRVRFIIVTGLGFSRIRNSEVRPPLRLSWQVHVYTDTSSRRCFPWVGPPVSPESTQDSPCKGRCPRL